MFKKRLQCVHVWVGAWIEVDHWPRKSSYKKEEVEANRPVPKNR